MSEKVPEGYQETDFGFIPKEWIFTSLVSAVNDKSSIVAGPFGSNLKVSDYIDSGVPIIRLQNIERNKFITKDIKYISNEKAKELNYHSFKKGDIVLAKLGSPIGKTCIVPDFMNYGIVVADVVRIRTSEKKASPKFLEYMLNSPTCAKQLVQGTIGTTRPRVNLSDIRNLKISMPTLPEQHKIASILSKVDEQIEQTEQIIERTEILKKGMLQKLLTKGIGHTKFKKTELGEIPEEWECKKLSNLIEVHHGFAFESKYFTAIPNGIIVLVPGNFHRDGGLYFNKNTKYYIGEYDPKNVLNNGDLLTVMTDLSPKMLILGRTVKLNHKKIILHNQRIGKIEILKPDELDDEYLLCLLNSDQIRTEIKMTSTGTTVKHTSPHKIKSVKIPIPPLVEQQQIASILYKVDSQIQDNQSYLAKLQELKKGLMQDLLTGKVRVCV